MSVLIIIINLIMDYQAFTTKVLNFLKVKTYQPSGSFEDLFGKKQVNSITFGGNNEKS